MKAVVNASVLATTLVGALLNGLWVWASIPGKPLAAPELALAEITNILGQVELYKVITLLEPPLPITTCCASVLGTTPSGCSPEDDGLSS